jgi:PAS domain S-box-containing protein
MNLRLKLTILLGVVIAVTVVLATSTVYRIAGEQLEKGATERLQQTAWLVSTQIEERFKALISSIEVWARTPMVRNALLNPDSHEMIDQVNRTFADIVRSDPIFQTFNLYNTQAAMIASSTPERVHVQMAQAVVRKREDFLAALTGKHTIKGPFMGRSSGQPAISLSVPVMREGHVIGVLRPIVSVVAFNEKFLGPLAKRQEGRVFIFAPDLDTEQKLKPLDPTLVINTPYISPDIPSMPEMLQHKQGVVRYTSSGVQCYAAFQWLKKLHALVVVELPLREVLAPIRHIKYTAFAIGLVMLVVIWFLAGMAIRPLLSSLRKCLQFVRTIRDGHMGERIQVKSSDDVGELALGLNEMAERLQSQHAALEESEIKYRSLFETAVEGIFQTTEDGRFLTANPAMATILGAESADTLLTHGVDDFYADPKQRKAIMDVLRQNREITSYEFDVKRLDGEVRKCLVHARAQMDKDGRLVMIQGIMHDVTDERLVEAARSQVETAEKLALRAKFRALRYQINPHFLFNVLNTIDVLSRKMPERIPDLLQKLASYLRHTLTPRVRMLVLLREEVKSIKSYLAVEQIRFKDHLAVNFEIHPDAAEQSLPDMLLQPLVENAIKYGMQTSSMPLRIIIRAEINHERLGISVRNTGHWVTENPSRKGHPGIGLANLRERLEIFYNDHFSLETSEVDNWVKIEICLPLEPSATFTPLP